MLILLFWRADFLRSAGKEIVVTINMAISGREATMGMFDYLRCEPDTPDGWKPEDGLFQTKSLDCTMLTHTITADGRLLRERIDNGEVAPGAPEDGLSALFGLIRIRTIEEYDSEFHGFLYFMALETVGFEPDTRRPGEYRPIYREHAYRGKFTDGRLVGLTLIAPKSEAS